jgi:hypothetical protein
MAATPYNPLSGGYGLSVFHFPLEGGTQGGSENETPEAQGLLKWLEII